MVDKSISPTNLKCFKVSSLNNFCGKDHHIDHIIGVITHDPLTYRFSIASLWCNLRCRSQKHFAFLLGLPFSLCIDFLHWKLKKDVLKNISPRIFFLFPFWRDLSNNKLNHADHTTSYGLLLKALATRKIDKMKRTRRAKFSYFA